MKDRPVQLAALGIALLALMAPPPCWAQALPTKVSLLAVQQAFRTDTPPNIDGECADACWDAAPVSALPFDFLSANPKPALVRTEVQAAFGREGLYLAIRAFEDQPERLRADHEGAEIWRDDSLEIYLAPGAGMPKEYHKFALNAAGRRWRERRARDRRQAGGASHWGVVPDSAGTEAPPEDWQVATTTNEAGWQAEIRIPWPHLGAKPELGDAWRFAVTRFSYTEDKRFAASAAGARFDNPGAFGYMVFGALAPDEPTETVSPASRIPGHWMAPLTEGRVLCKGPAGVHMAPSAQAALRERRAKLATAVEARLADLAADHPVLHRAARRMLKEIVTMKDQPQSPAELAAALRSLNRAVKRLPDLDPTVKIAGPRHNPEKGVDVFTVRSPYLGGENKVEVLLPDDLADGKTYPVLYALPVEAGIGGKYGDCLQAIREANLHNRFGLICATMAFDTTPWYGNHATDPAIRHETYITKVVLPLVEKNYPVVAEREGRLLVGFSKSGWGAVSLLLRNSRVFGYAASWDAPLIMDEASFERWGIDRHFGTAEQFKDNLPTTWARKNAAAFRETPRLAILGHNFFGNRWACPKHSPHTATFHALLEQVRIPHTYNNDIRAPHDWNRTWLEPAVEAVAKLRKQAPVE